MDIHGGTNTGSLWVLYLQPNRLKGFRLDYFHSQTAILCGIIQIIGGGDMTGREYLGWLIIVV